MSILKTVDLIKYYKISKNDKFRALNNVNLEFEKGEIVSILGESGSGKSTLMNVLGGLDTDYQGEVIVDGKNIKKFKEKELDKYRKNKIGFIFQSFNLIPHLSVLDNVTIAMTLSNVSKSKRVKRAIEVLTDLGIRDQMHKKPSQLSGGQKQRVAIARSLVNDPDIILADEPTGALDSETSMQILEILRGIAEKGKLIIMVTHSELVASISQRVVTIKDGEIINDEVRINNPEYKEEEISVNKNKQNLSFFSAIKLALNNMKEKLTRNVLVALGASIGIMSVITMLSLGEGVKSYVTEKMNENVNPKVIEVNKKTIEPERFQKIDNATSGNSTSDNSTDTYFSDSELDKLSKINGVDKVEDAYSEMGMGNKITTTDRDYNLQYITTVSDNILSSNIKAGDLPKANQVMISASLSEKMVSAYSDIIGKSIQIDLLVDNKVVTHTFNVSGVYETGFGMNQALFNYNDLKSIYKDNGVDIKPTTVYLVMKNKNLVNDAKSEVAKMGYAPSMADQIINTFNQMLDVLTYVLSGVAAISLFVSAIMILVVLYISVVERTNEIGVLKAIGARRRDIKRIFVSEAFLIGLGAGIIGVLFAYLIKVAVNHYTYKAYTVNVVKINPEFVIFGILVSVIISVLSGLWPASRAAKLDPIESLRHE